MSWLEKIANAVFPPPDAATQRKLPLPPSVMVAGSPLYHEIPPSKDEVIARIEKEVIATDKRLKSFFLSKIIEAVIRDSTWVSHRDYYIFLHKLFVKETLELALEQYEKRHQKNMRWFYIVAILKPKVRKVVQRFRNRRRMRYWTNENNINN
jgi:hypothetical protein